MLEALRAEVEAGFRAIGTTSEGWNALMQAVRRWVLYREPADGRIRAGDVRIAAKLWDPRAREISQDFPGDAKGHIANEGLAGELHARLDSHDGQYLLLTGPPGSGKTSFLSAFARSCESNDTTIVIRHHCFIRLDDPEYYERLRADVAARDLMRQLYGHFYEELAAATGERLNVENPSVRDLSSWLRVCLTAARSRGKSLLLVLDGLDHAVDEADSRELRELLAALPVPAPAGLACILGSQPRAGLLPSRLRGAVAAQYECTGFDRRGIEEYAAAYLGLEPSGELLDALQEMTEGNPLHLHYVMMEAPDDNAADPAWIRAIPPYGGNISAYYERLWEQLSTAGRALSVVLCELSFSLPESEVADVMVRMQHSPAESAQAIESTRHLMFENNGALRLYHASFRAFIAARPEAGTFTRPAREAIRSWIVERGGEEIRWAWEWDYSLRCGDRAPLLNGTTTAWAVHSLASLRPTRRIGRLMELASETALDQEDLALAYEKGGLLWKLNELDELDEAQPALQYLREAKIATLGAPYLAPTALDHDHPWGTGPLAALARNAALNGDTEISKEAFDLIQDTVVDADRVDDSALAILYRAAACAGVPVPRVASHYVRSRGDDGEPRPSFGAYAEELVILRAEGCLRQLYSAQGLRSAERSVVLDALCELVPLGNDGMEALGSVVADESPLHLSNFSALHLHLRGMADVPAHDLPGFPANLSDGAPWYGQDALWAKRFRDTFWRAVRLEVLGRIDGIEEFEQTLETDGRERRQALDALIQLGRHMGAFIAGGQLDVSWICDVVDELGWPLFWPHSEREFRELIDKVWLDCIRRAMRLASQIGRPVTLSPADIRLLWVARGSYQPVLRLVEVAGVALHSQWHGSGVLVARSVARDEVGGTL